MAVIVILEETTVHWLIVDNQFDDCPDSPVSYTNTVNMNKSPILRECGEVTARHVSGAETTARAVEI